MRDSDHRNPGDEPEQDHRDDFERVRERPVTIGLSQTVQPFEQRMNSDRKQNERQAGDTDRNPFDGNLTGLLEWIGQPPGEQFPERLDRPRYPRAEHHEPENHGPDHQHDREFNSCDSSP